MALIGKIRNNSWILIVLIAVGMGGFLLQDVVTNQGQRKAGNFEMANINGKSIDYREFQKTEDILYSGTANSDGYAQKASLWRYFMEKAIVESEAEQLGIGVSKDELIDLQFGQNLSPIITTRFKDQSGQIDRQRLNSFRDAIEANELEARFKQYWAVQEKEIIKDRQQKKLQNLFSKAVYTPNWMAEEISKEGTSTAEFNFVKIPFDKLGDEEVEITDDVIKAYLKKHSEKYTNKEESRILKYIEFEVLPTAKDSLSNKNDLATIGQDFKSASNDSLFVINNSGNYSPIYYKPEDLPENIKNFVTDMEVGDIHGPYFDVDKYTVAKVVDKKMVADSVKARHILQPVNYQDAASFQYAQGLIDSLKNLLVEGTATFDSLAIKHSQDPGSASKGGDLGYFAQGTMVAPFNYACFFGDKNEYQVVNTQFGIHLIEVTNTKFLDNNPKYKVAYVSNAIIPSQETQDSLYEIATELVTSSTDLSSLANQINADSMYELKESAPLKMSDYIFMNYGSAPASREIIRWAYEPGVEQGDVSPVIYAYSDDVNYYNSNYLVIALDKTFPEGLKSVEEARNAIELLVINELKGEKIASQITSSDLDAIATQFDVTVDTMSAVTFNSTFIPGLGNEPKVVSTVFNANINEVSSPIVGNSGVFVVRPNLVTLSDAPASNFIQQKTSTESKVKNEVSYKFLEALKKNADLVDNRYMYY